MFERTKQSLVESFVGAIALGWLFAQGIVHFANIFAAPVAGWVVRGEFPRSVGNALAPTSLLLRDAAPELVRSFLLFLVSYILLRWLYFKPAKEETPGPPPRPEQSFVVGIKG